MKLEFQSNKNGWCRFCFIAALLMSGAALLSCTTAKKSAVAHGLNARLPSKAFLQMPERASGTLPRLLSLTGVFKDMSALVPNTGLMPYDLIVSFWSDGASKSRWVAVPNGKIKFAPTGEWGFPEGTVFVKHFDLATDDAHPGS